MSKINKHTKSKPLDSDSIESSVDSTNDTESKRLDSNGDEILWELKQKKSITFFYSWCARWAFFFGGIYCIIIGIQKYLSRNDNSLYITIILLICVVFWFIVSPLEIYKTLNTKSMFVTHKNLIIERYVGKKIILSLGSFYIMIISSYGMYGNLLLCETLKIVGFSHNDKYELQVARDNIKNLNNLYEILKPHIIEFLCSLNNKEYEEFKILNMLLIKDYHTNLYKNGSGQFDIDEINNLRKGNNDKSNS